MMNYYVPDFEMEDEQNLISTSSTITRHKVDDEILELLWQDGQVIAQPQNQRKSPQIPAPLPAPLQQPPPPPQPQLYMAEDEMATWLHYPIEDLYSELLCENQTTSPLPPVTNARNFPEVVRSLPAGRPPTPPPQQQTSVGNFQLFSRMRGHDLERAGSLRPGLTEVESNSTPMLATMKSVGEVSSAFPTGDGGGGERLEKGGGSGEVTVSSSSGTSAGPIITRTANTASEEGEDRKRKRKEIDESTQPTTTDQSMKLLVMKRNILEDTRQRDHELQRSIIFQKGDVEIG